MALLSKTMMIPLQVAALAAAALAAPEVVDDVPKYTIDFSKSADKRWTAAISDFVATRSTEPFVAVYDAIHRELEESDADSYNFYKEHLGEFEQAYKDHFNEALAEMKSLAAVLQDKALNDQEKEAMSWERIFIAQLATSVSSDQVPGWCKPINLLSRTPDGQGVVHIRNWACGTRPDALGSATGSVEFKEEDGSSFTCMITFTHVTEWSACVRPQSHSMTVNDRTDRPSAEEMLKRLQAAKPPRGVVMERIMKAHSFGEALSVAATSQPMTGMYVLLADGASSASENTRMWAGGATVTLFSEGRSSLVKPVPVPGSGSEDWFLVQYTGDHGSPGPHNTTTSKEADHLRGVVRDLTWKATSEQLVNAMVNPDDEKVFPESTIATVFMSASKGLYKPFQWKRLSGAEGCASAFHQCGGEGFTGPHCCEAGCTCNAKGDFFYQCQTPTGDACPGPPSYNSAEIFTE